MKNVILVFLLLGSATLFAQKDSLRLGDHYLEDQLYLGITYNKLFNQPDLVLSSGFSYSIFLGYIKDIPLVKSGKFALGLGVGYAYNSFLHGLKISSVNDEVVFEAAQNIDANKFSTHAIEFPLEIRWRTSTANRYRFWRIYTGLKVSYHFKNTFNYQTPTDLLTYTNVNRFNKVQYGITLSAGYAAFNLHIYYGLSPLFKDATVGTPTIDTKVLKMGLIIYIL